MGLEVCTIGGYTKTGGNSVAIKVDDEVVIFDMGLSMEEYIHHTEEREDVGAKDYFELLKANAVPNYKHLKDWKEKVIAIIPSHGHLDHVGAIPFAAPLFETVPIICTPYTAEILQTILKDERISIPNQIISLKSNGTLKISDKITVEFVHITHSIPDTVIVVLHTPYGKVMYANDYKLDRHPTLGAKPNFKRIKQLGDKGVTLLIQECLYAHERRKMPSERVAKQMLEEVMLGCDCEGKGLLVTTFSSHIARLKSIIALGKKLNRKIVFLGRSLAKYVKAAQRVGLVDFEKDVKIVRFRDKVEKELSKIMKQKGKYLIVCTGHQGEPKAILSRMARGEHDYQFEQGDVVVFSCSVIPVESNIENREELERELHNKRVRIYTEVHASGHAAREDHREMFQMIRPKHLIPAHAGEEKAKLLAELAEHEGVEHTHIMQDGKRITLQ